MYTLSNERRFQINLYIAKNENENVTKRKVLACLAIDMQIDYYFKYDSHSLCKKLVMKAEELMSSSHGSEVWTVDNLYD